MRAEVGGVGQGRQLVQRFLSGFQSHLPFLQLPVGRDVGGIVAAGGGGGQLQVILTAPDDDTDAVVKVGVAHLKGRIDRSLVFNAQ